MDQSKSSFKSAFIAFVGRPNSGKSTLLNTILGEELAIVTSLPQTTQKNMRGILNGDDYQLVFVDTPGIHKGKHVLNKSMFNQSTQLFSDSGIDLLCYIVDLSRPFGKEEELIAEKVTQFTGSVVIIFNKADSCSSIEKVTGEFYKKFPDLLSIKNLVISALVPSTKDVFLSTIDPLIPLGPKYYPDGDLTDCSMRFFASEYIRKQVIENTEKEVPHAACVEILAYNEMDDHHQIEATVHVETQGQKGIVIGKKGGGINKIKRLAQKELSKLTGTPVKISCTVKVTPKWRDNKSFLNEMGMET